MRIDLFFERVERFSDYIPGVSTITNLVALILKGTRYFFVERHIETNRYYQHLNDKSFARLVILLVPFLGNMAIGIYDFFKVRGEPAIQAQSAQLNFEESLTAWCSEKSGTDEYYRRLSAAEKIRICYSSQETSLSLSCNHLTSLPGAICQLTNLTYLNLSGNHLTSLPDAIVQLTNLTYLSLSGNQLASFPDAIVQLTNLTDLNLSYNQLNSLPDAICQLTNLTYLSLSGNHLTSLPGAICQLTNLTYLSLFGNHLTSLPDAICQLTNLTDLNLSGNHLTSLPDAIVQLTNLTYLSLSGNQLASFPDAIVQLTNLTDLNLSYNQLNSLPDAIVQLTNLTDLNLSYNQLASLPDAICQLAHLTHLYLSCNQLASFPDAICQLTNLTDLNLSYNQLNSLPNQIVELPSTCSIDLINAGLSENILQRLREAMTLRERNHLSVPRINFSMPAPHSERGQSIDEMIHSLYLIIEKTPSDLSRLKAADTDNYLSMWLNRLSWTASYQIRGETQKRFVANIINYLEEAARNPEFCKLFLQLIVEASDTCGDRVALSVITVGIQHALATFDISDTKGLADFVIRGGMAMGLLEYYARDVVSKLSFVDEIEVYLGLPIMLKERLHLPINIQEMLYFGCSSLTQAHLADAEKFVRGQIDDPEARKEFLIHNDIWLKALSKKYPEEFARIRENYLLDQNKAEEEAVWKIRKTYEDALKRLTERASL